MPRKSIFTEETAKCHVVYLGGTQPMNNVYKILRKLDPDTLPQDMRGMSFSYKLLPDLSGKRY